MRTILFVALFATAVCVQASDARAQAGGVQPKPSPAATAPKATAPTAKTPAASAAAKTPASDAAAEIAARPDAFRYYWHNGEWWYFTAQNNWLRWNGKAWVVHHSINDTGAFAPAQVAQPTDDSYAPTTDDSSYRYQINRRKGGL